MPESNGTCKDHTGVQHDIIQLKETNAAVWKAISERATVKLVCWGIGIFLLVSMAVVGFLSHNQSKMEESQNTFREFLVNPKDGLLIQMKDMSAENNRLIKEHIALSGGEQPDPRTGSKPWGKK